MFGLKTGLLGGSGNLVFNRFTGPGRLGLQSGYYTPFAGGTGNADAGATRSAGCSTVVETVCVFGTVLDRLGQDGPQAQYQDAFTP